MVVSSELIVLASTKVGEKSLVIHCMSRDWGRRSFIVSLTRQLNSAYFLPLNIIEAEVIENPKSDLWRVRNFRLKHALPGLRGNISKNTMSLFMSEVLYRTIKDGAHEDGLFEWTCNSILTLDALDQDFSNYHLRFLMELCTALGFDLSMEGLTPFAGEYYGVLGDLHRASFAEFMLYPLNGQKRNRLAEILLKYLSFHCESSINVRSLAVLREVFA